MKLGITGTRNGMTEDQKQSFYDVITGLSFEEFHHGGCEGVDVQAAYIVSLRDAVKIVCHPGPGEGGNIKIDNEVRAPLPHLKRNRTLAREVDCLIVIPRETEWRASGGTWFTYDVAGKAKKRVITIWPNGLVSDSEDGKIVVLEEVPRTQEVKDMFVEWIAPNRKIVYKPKPDITTYELAQLLRFMILWSRSNLFPGVFDTMAPELKRHFEEVKDVAPLGSN